MARRELDDITSSHHGGVRTSEEANETVTPFKSTQRYDILRLITKYTPEGISSDEVERITGYKHQSAASRITELYADGLIMVCGYSKTRSGCRCRLYVAVPEVITALIGIEQDEQY